MPAKNPRLQVVLSADLLARYKAAAEAFGQPASKVAADILEESIGVIEQAAQFLRRAKEDQQNASKIVAEGLTGLVLGVRQDAADAQVHLEDVIAASKAKSKKPR